jgi:hypothetical protein
MQWPTELLRTQVAERNGRIDAVAQRRNDTDQRPEARPWP